MTQCKNEKRLLKQNKFQYTEQTTFMSQGRRQAIPTVFHPPCMSSKTDLKVI